MFDGMAFHPIHGESCLLVDTEVSEMMTQTHKMQSLSAEALRKNPSNVNISEFSQVEYISVVELEESDQH